MKYVLATLQKSNCEYGCFTFGLSNCLCLILIDCTIDSTEQNRCKFITRYEVKQHSTGIYIT